MADPEISRSVLVAESDAAYYLMFEPPLNEDEIHALPFPYGKATDAAEGGWPLMFLVLVDGKQAIGLSKISLGLGIASTTQIPKPRHPEKFSRFADVTAEKIENVMNSYVSELHHVLGSLSINPARRGVDIWTDSLKTPVS